MSENAGPAQKAHFTITWFKQSKMTRSLVNGKLKMINRQNIVLFLHRNRISTHNPERCTQPWHHHDKVREIHQTKLSRCNRSIGYRWNHLVNGKTAILAMMYLIEGISEIRNFRGCSNTLSHNLHKQHIRLIELKGNIWDLAGAFDVWKSLKRYLTLTPYICGNLYDWKNKKLLKKRIS